jgi:membrane dipeptidase
VFHKLGVRVVGLTYNNRNVVGSGCLEPDDGRMTRFGLEVVREMNRLGILVDLTHVGNRTSLDAAAASSAPVVFSHSNAKAVRNNPRNLTDEQIRACAATGGVIGIATFADFVGTRLPTPHGSISGTSTMSCIAGEDHVGIGTDIFADHPRNLVEQRTRMRYLSLRRHDPPSAASPAPSTTPSLAPWRPPKPWLFGGDIERSQARVCGSSGTWRD